MPDQDDIHQDDIKKEGIGHEVMEDMRRMNAEWEKDKQTGKQLGLGLATVEAEDEDSEGLDLLKDTQNPEAAYDLNYAIRRELMNHLPPGKQWKKLRDFVYEEKNIYLRRGKQKAEAPSGVIGADSRQAYLHHFKVVLEAVRKWAAAGGTPIEVFYELYELNREAGYRPKMYDGPLAIQGDLDDVLGAAVSDEEPPK